MNYWDKIAGDFDAKRKFPWKECLDFISSISGTCLDLGCGGGRHLAAMKEKCFAVGADISFSMLEIAREKAGDAFLVCCDARNLPFLDETFDNALFIAALHNIEGKEERRKALSELRRILKKEGRAIISVWAKWQDRFIFHFIKKFFKKQGEHGDILVPWKKNGEEIMRFYHLYSMIEFKKELKESGFKIEKAWSVKKASKWLKDNHFAIVRKEN
ncbi:MAG: class I SAM-dependent methyltransferase [Thermoplasmatales archaeon]|nr:class I SAM-dependent methyltransferase [Thermoplasmatales archaeon]